jgi:ABC-type proline/glycine betaine transport system permease subunit
MDVKLTIVILLLALLGGVLVAYLWETLNQLASGLIDLRRLLITVPVLAAFLLLLRYLARFIEGWHGETEV